MHSSGIWVGRSLPTGVEFRLEDDVLKSDERGFLVMGIQQQSHSNNVN